MTAYTKGYRAERRVMHILEAAGYQTARSAGSHGCWDVMAWDTQRIRLIQVKAGNARASALEREVFSLLPVPPNATKEIWRLRDRQEPEIEVLS